MKTDKSLIPSASEPAFNPGPAAAPLAVRASGAKALARHLSEAIAKGVLPSGFKLASERVLAEQFQASRGSVRRVLSDLKQRGLITQAVGSGTFVAAADGTSEDAVAQVSPAELMAGRILIEPLLPALIVQHATRADFARMAECLLAAEAAASIEEFEQWDGALHQALAEATHNKFILQVMALASRVREQGEWGRLKRDSMTAERRRRYQEQHRQIVAALQDRDEEKARLLLKQHLLQIQQNLFSR